MINIANTWKRLAKKLDVTYWVKSHVKKKIKDSLGKKKGKERKGRKIKLELYLWRRCKLKEKIFPADEYKNVENTETESKATILLMIFW